MASYKGQSTPNKIIDLDEKIEFNNDAQKIVQVDFNFLTNLINQFKNTKKISILRSIDQQLKNLRPNPRINAILSQTDCVPIFFDIFNSNDLTLIDLSMSIINRLKVFSPIPVQYLKANLGIFPFLFQNPNYLKYINLLLPDVVRGDPEATGSLTFEHHIVEVIIQNIPNYDKDMYFFSLFSFLHLIFKNLRREDLYVQINEIPLILLPLEAIHQYIQTKTNTVLENILDLLDDIINYWNDSLSIILPPEFIGILLKITEKPFEIDKLGNGNLLMQLLKVWNRCILSFIKIPDCEKLVITLLNILVGHVKAIPFKYQHLMPSVMPKILLIFSNIAFYKETAEYLLKSDAFTFLLDNYQNMQFDMKESFLFIFCNAAINWPDIVLEKCDFISLVNDCLDLESNNKKFLCVLMKTIYAIFNYDNSTLEIIDIDEIKEFLERFIDSDDNELYTLSNKIMDDFLSESEEEVPDKLFLQ